MKNEISVVIPCTRPGWLLQRAVESVSKESSVKKIIVVFNGVNASYGYEQFKTYAAKNRKLHCMERPDVYSAPEARNIGLSLVTSDYVHFLDDDDFVLPDFYTKALASFKGNVVGVAASANIITERTSEIVDVAFRRKSTVSLHDLYIENYVGVTSGVVLNTSVVLASGGFDVTMPARQDYALWLGCSVFGHFVCLKDITFCWTENVLSPSISNDVLFDKHVVAINKLRQIKKVNTSNAHLRCLEKLQAESNHQKYLAKMHKKNRSPRYWFRSFLALILFPSPSVLALFLNKKFTAKMKRVIYKP
ncbi:glycosyltransferase family 2 protein [Saccharospirillum mangrovi]|uniref:glycosyltransferase family 2 protein n=1 Tax=Saccharospirillum mangrovi TaxID=2161747 RepID=UPI000D3DBDA4|nr:glycosyltransferase [Saccharospirillum mangrovi]